MRLNLPDKSLPRLWKYTKQKNEAVYYLHISDSNMSVHDDKNM